LANKWSVLYIISVNGCRNNSHIKKEDVLTTIYLCKLTTLELPSRSKIVGVQKFFMVAPFGPQMLSYAEFVFAYLSNFVFKTWTKPFFVT